MDKDFSPADHLKKAGGIFQNHPSILIQPPVFFSDSWLNTRNS
jgi:hypothetical protein